MEHSPLTTSRPSPRHHLSHLSSPRPPHHFFPSPNLEPRRRSEREELSLTTSTRTPHLATSRTSLPTSPAYRLPSLSPLSSARPSRAARCASTSPTSTCATTSRRRWTWWTRSPSPPVPFVLYHRPACAPFLFQCVFCVFRGCSLCVQYVFSMFSKTFRPLESPPRTLRRRRRRSRSPRRCHRKPLTLHHGA